MEVDGLLAQLQSFNAKERFWLISFATGNPPLSEPFRSTLSAAVGRVVPRNAWWAMDYHIDWIEAALECAASPETRRFEEPQPGRNVNRSQEDVDLVVAWDEGAVTWLVVVEAKGTTSWAQAQYDSKLQRLVHLFGADGTRRPNVVPSFVLASPRRPKRLAVSNLPAWSCGPNGQPPWIPLSMPKELHRLQRCDALGNPSAKGTYWQVAPRARSER